MLNCFVPKALDRQAHSENLCGPLDHLVCLPQRYGPYCAGHRRSQDRYRRVKISSPKLTALDLLRYAHVADTLDTALPFSPRKRDVMFVGDGASTSTGANCRGFQNEL